MLVPAAASDPDPDPALISHQASFRDITFEGQCSTYRIAAGMLALALAAFAAFDVLEFACGPLVEGLAVSAPWWRSRTPRGGSRLWALG